MPEDEENTEENIPPQVDLSKLTSLLTDVSKTDESGKQVNPITVLIIAIVIGFLIAGVGISMAVAKRKAVKAQYEADKLKEDAKRAESDAKVADLQAAVETKMAEAASLAAKAEEHEKEAAAARESYEAYAIELAGATTWDDIKVRRADDET